MLQTPSPNFNERADGQDPSMIVMHYTGMQSAQEAIDRLCDPDAEVSAHFVVEEDGTMHQLVDVGNRAWHAGVAFWRGVRDVNSASIGIEIVNPGHEFGYREFPHVQMDSVVDLSLELIQKFGIESQNVVGHSDIAPSRKQDPGELFDWQYLAARGVGSWREPDGMDMNAALDFLHDQGLTRELLSRAGYDPDCAFGDVVAAFQRRYCPEQVRDGAGDVLALDGAARLLALLRGV